jgi:thiol-disulfide isomerase/thioredoxin
MRLRRHAPVAIPAMTTAILLLLLAGAIAPAARAATVTARRPLPVVPVTAAQLLERVARRGARATVVNVWATWCAPCRAEFPALLRVSRAHAAEGARLVLVSADFTNQLPAIRRFLAAHGVRDTTFLKSGGDMEFIDGLDPKWSGALPATFIYDASGRLTTFWEGAADSARFDRALIEALHLSTQPSTH